MPNNSRIHVLHESLPFMPVSRNILYLTNFRFYQILNVTLSRTTKEDDFDLSVFFFKLIFMF